ncbi:MAG TPA: hypothetical protein VMQ60_03255 [Acidobacteriaceae bacterium]|jgi:hypothetical protein|nr:hypothetical protein [Acidobacteriaceae bacterium]
MAVNELTPLQAQQRENMHVLFPQSDGRRVAKDPGTRHTNSMRATLEKQIKQTGSDRPVTLLNLNPIALKINGGMFHPEEIPACPLDQPYVVYVFGQTRWGHKDKGVGLDNVHQIDPFPEIPKRLAGEYMREYQQEKDGFGGVLCYVGDHHPSTIKKGEMVMVPVVTYVDGDLVMDEEERDFHQLLGIVRTKRNQSLMRDIQEAVSWHENPEQAKNVNDSHRDKARMAKREGLIPELPRFCMHENLLTEKQPDPCPVCVAIPKAGAILCTNCNHVFNPLEAYRNTKIAYGAVEMDRMTELEWKIADQLKAQRDHIRAGRGVKGQ